MRQGTKLLISASVLVMLGVVFLVGKPEPISGQRMSEIPSNRKPACSVFCGDATMNYVVLAEPPACWGGPLPAGSAGDHFKELPKDAQNMICKNLKSAGRTDTSCPAFKTLMAACDQDEKESPKDQPPPEAKRDPPAGGSPWNPSDDCKDRQHVRFRRLGKNYVFIACGQVIGKIIPYETESLIEFARAMWPDTICCDRFKEPGNAPCDYSIDVDCDGNLNGGDDFPDNYVEEFLYTIPPGAPPDPLPQGLRRQQILPGSACDGGKWELMKGNNRCKSKGKSTSLFWYEATWKCPKTGMEVSKASSPTLLQQKCK